MTIDRLARIVRLRLRSLGRGTALDRELDEELQYHADRLTEEHVARGLSPAEARRAALVAIGGVEQRKEACRDARGVSFVDHALRDVRLALRQLSRQPAFTVAAIVSLALGIGANTAMVQLLDALAYRALPVAAPGELVEIRLEGDGRAGRHTGRNRQWSQPQWQALQERQDAFQSMLAFGDTRFNLATTGEVRYVEGLWVSGSFFSTLRVAPEVGRLFVPEDDTPGCGLPGAVISYALWQREFGGRADVLDQTIPFGSSRVKILGVTPRTFFGVEVGRSFDVAMPLCAAGYERRDHWWLAAIGRLKPGWSIAQAQAHFAQIVPAIQRDTMPLTFDPEHASAYDAMRPVLVSARAGVSPLRQAYRQPLWILTVISALVLLIGSVNLANLLLARAAAREQEFTVRLAIGGSRGRVFQQVFTESLVLAAMGSVAAVGVAALVSRSLVAMLSTRVDPIYLDVAPDWRIFAATSGVALAAAVLFGILPAVRAARASELRPGPRTATAAGGLATRRWLVSAQLAFTVVLLFGALLFLRSFVNLSTEDMGIRPDRVVIANVFFPPAAFPPERRAVAYADLERSLEAMPGVSRVAEAFTTPIGGSFSDRDIRIRGQLAGNSNVNVVSAGYFDAVGTPLLAGRDFDQRDTAGSPRVAIVNESFAARFLDGQALGKRVATVNDPGTPDTEYEIVGIVGNQKYLLVREPFPPIFYPASSQEPPGLTRRYVIRSAAAPPETMREATAILGALDPSITVRYASLSAQVADAMIQDRLMARLAGIFALVALLLATVGLYGVVAYGVACRRAEIGLRLALGATRSTVLAMMLREVAVMIAIGAAAGTVVSLVASRTLGSLLFELQPSDPVTLGAAVLLLVIAGVGATISPSWRAAGTDPLRALRE